MNTDFLLVDSVTYAIKARRALAQIGIRATIKKVNAKTTKHGCQYGIFFERRLLFSVTEELNRQGIPFEKRRELTK
jgi:hypothetical protein